MAASAGAAGVTRVGAFVAGLALVFAAAFGVGSAVGSTGDGPAPAPGHHGETPTSPSPDELPPGEPTPARSAPDGPGHGH